MSMWERNKRAIIKLCNKFVIKSARIHLSTYGHDEMGTWTEVKAQRRFSKEFDGARKK